MIEAALAGAAALGAYAAGVAPRRLRILRETAALPGLTAPLRAAVIADLQPWRMHWPAERLRLAFARAQRFHPDIVLWLGDYFNAPTKRLARGLARAGASALYDRLQTPFGDIAAAMGTLTAPMGAFAVLGNHDWAWDGDATAQGLRAVGITPLVGAAATATHPDSGARLTVVGLDDASADRPTGAARLLPADGPAVLLTHAPDVWDFADVAPHAPALTLAGHTHGGQIAPPGIGPLRLTDLGRTYVRGWYARGDQRLFVSSGIGCSGLPMRLGVVPEIVMLDLTPAPA